MDGGGDRAASRSRRRRSPGRPDGARARREADRVAIDVAKRLLGCREGRVPHGRREPLAGPRPPGGGRAGVPPERSEPLAVRRGRQARLRPQRGLHVRHAPPQPGLRREVPPGRAPAVPASARRGPGHRGQVRDAQVRADLPAAAVRGARERSRGVGLGAPGDRGEADAGVDAAGRVRRSALHARREEPCEEEPRHGDEGEKQSVGDRKRRKRRRRRRFIFPRVFAGVSQTRGE